MNFKNYNQELLERDHIKEAIEDEDYDDQQYLYTLDNSVIATGFAQLVDEGLIEAANKPIIQLAITRQIIWAEFSTDWENADQYIDNLKVLNTALKLA